MAGLKQKNNTSVLLKNYKSSSYASIGVKYDLISYNQFSIKEPKSQENLLRISRKEHDEFRFRSNKLWYQGYKMGSDVNPNYFAFSNIGIETKFEIVEYGYFDASKERFHAYANVDYFKKDINGNKISSYNRALWEGFVTNRRELYTFSRREGNVFNVGNLQGKANLSSSVDLIFSSSEISNIDIANTTSVII
jgi:hypothetical protein